MYSTLHSVNIWTFIHSIGAGYVIGIILELFRLFRQCFLRGKVAVFIQDIFFFVFASAVTFLFTLNSSYGIVRAYILFGEAIGFFIYLITFGSAVFRFGKIYASRVQKCNARTGIKLKKMSDSINKKIQCKRALTKKTKIKHKRKKDVRKIRKKNKDKEYNKTAASAPEIFPG